MLHTLPRCSEAQKANASDAGLISRFLHIIIFYHPGSAQSGHCVRFAAWIKPVFKMDLIKDHPEQERPEEEETTYPELSGHPDYQVLRVYMQTIEEEEE